MLPNLVIVYRKKETEIWAFSLLTFIQGLNNFRKVVSRERARDFKF